MNIKTVPKEINTKSNRKIPKQLEFIPGLWLDGSTYWLKGVSEKLILDGQLLLKIQQEHVHSRIRFYTLQLSNHGAKTKRAKVLAMQHHPEPAKSDFTFVSPADNVIFHLTDDNIFMVNGFCRSTPEKECTILPFWNINSNQIWSSREKGSLKYQPMAKGDTAGLLSFDVVLNPKETAKIGIWSIYGESKSELLALNKSLLKNRLAFPLE